VTFFNRAQPVGPSTGNASELLLLISFDFRRLHGLREAQSQRVAVIGLGLPALLHVRLLSSTAHCVAKNTLNRPHPDPSPVSGD
jgi:hypothetical protein